MKWIALCCWNDGFFGLFSMLNGSLVWRTKLKTSGRHLYNFIPLKFDRSCTKLIINTNDTLYVFAPACLIEDYELEFLSKSVNLTQEFRHPPVILPKCCEILLPKRILRQAFFEHYKLDSQYSNDVLDIANSRRISSIALLILKGGQLNIVQGSFKTLFASSFKEYIQSGWSSEKLPSDMETCEIKLDALSHFQVMQILSFGKLAWIFEYPSEEKDKDSFVTFLSYGGLVAFFIDNTTNGRLNQISFGNQECFAIEQSKDGAKAFCLDASSIMTIDLRKKTILSRVVHKANLAQWSLPHIRKRYYAWRV